MSIKKLLFKKYKVIEFIKSEIIKNTRISIDISNYGILNKKMQKYFQYFVLALKVYFL